MAVRFETHTEPITGYRLIERLGSGGFGEVWKAEAPGGIFKAIKIIHGDLRNRETDAYRFAEQEFKSLMRVKQVRHSYLLALDRIDIVEGRLMIVMELADCNLWDRFRACRRQGLPGIPRDELMQYMAETAEVLDLMNDQFQLQHLDIKPQNLFLLYQHVKVADFGQVKDLEGMVASVTGGITPVYAAPETFDGFVSRFCDQYSLACVYQELLTGVRPFDGASMQQLLLQHLQMPPNLQPSPPGDRPALARALAKQADQRFPNVRSMVEALRAGSNPAARVSVSAPTTNTPTAIAANTPERAGGATSCVPLVPAPPSVIIGGLDSPPPRAPSDTPFPERPAPPEVTGNGPIRPALVIGIGYTGLRVLQRFRKQVADRFGPPEQLASIRAVYLDTDPDAIAAATADQPWSGLAPLREDEVIAARLNRPGHYLKPRLSGRTLVEGWFDSQLLYRLPRTPVTMGLRAFGRLAFCDYYRPIMQKLEADLDACLDPQALADTQTVTGQTMRTNRPRVYVVAGLGGGTGSGMFLDVAYAVRARLKRIGYAEPDVVGVLLAPPDAAADEISPQAQANTYAALTELHHYARPDTAFAANYDERGGVIHDPDPAFTQVFLLPGLPHPPGPPPGGSGLAPPAARASGSIAASQMSRGASGAIGRSGVISRSGVVSRSGMVRSSGTVRSPLSRSTPSARIGMERSGATGWGRDGLTATRFGVDLDGADGDPSAVAADFLRLELLAPVGRLVEATRPRPIADAPPVAVRTCGVTRIGWPRAEVVARAARVMAPVLLSHWVSPDPAHVRQTIPKWAAEQWARLGLDAEGLSTRLALAADDAAGARLTQVIAVAAEQLSTKRGWLTRLPDPKQVSLTMDQLQRLLGRPKVVAGLPRTPVEEAIVATSNEAIEVAERELVALFPQLIELPEFRLAGAEEAIRQLINLLDQTRTQQESHLAELETVAAATFDQLISYANIQKGMRKPPPAEFEELIAHYPTAQHRLVIARGVVRTYRRLRDVLTGQLAAVSGCRQRVEACLPTLKAEADIPAAARAPGEMLPPGCASIEDAAQTFLRSLTDDDLIALDGCVQHGLEQLFGGLYEACLNSTEGANRLTRLIREEAWMYLNARLGEVDLSGMFTAQHGSRQVAAEALVQAYDDAAPALVGGGPWARSQVSVFACPSGLGGEHLRQLAAGVFPEGIAPAESHDEVILYREYPSVPLVAVPQLGPAWSAAYRAAPETQQVSPHARMDVTVWADVDAV